MWQLFFFSVLYQSEIQAGVFLGEQTFLQNKTKGRLMKNALILPCVKGWHSNDSTDVTLGSE